MKKVILSLLIFVFLFSVFAPVNREEEISLIEKFTYAGELVYDEYQLQDFDEDDLEFSGTALVLELDEEVGVDRLRNEYLQDVNDENVEEKLALYRAALKEEYKEARKNFRDSFPYLISEEDETASPYLFYSVDYEVTSFWDLDEEIISVINDDHVKEVIAYSLYHVNPVLECMFTYCGGGAGGSSGGGGSPSKPSNSTIDPKYDFENILDTVNGKNHSYTGNNVRVGILDGSVIRTSNSGFYGRSVIRRDSDTTSIHGTNVANVAVGNGGIAPNSIIYSSTASGDDGSLIGVNNINQLQWFVDRGVSVINMSLGLYYNYYSSTPEIVNPINRAFDQYIYENFITLVAASGNIPYAYIGAPGLSNNIITVGSTNEKGISMSDFSTYGVPYNIAKPNLVAPGEMKIPYGIPWDDQFDELTNKTRPYTGTSFAAPMVTGAIALAFEAKPILQLYPEAVNALLTSTANINKLTHTKEEYAGYDNKAGAGVLDIGKFLQSVNDFTLFEASSNSTALSNGVTMAEFYAPANTNISASLFWFCQINEATRTITDYDLYIYLDNVRIGYKGSASNNAELLRVKTNSAGTVRIIVKMYGAKRGNLTDYGAVAWST